MHVSLMPEMERFVREKVAAGQFNSPTEVVHAALTLMKETEALTPAVWEELMVGLDSAPSVPLTHPLLQDVKRRARETNSNDR